MLYYDDMMQKKRGVKMKQNAVAKATLGRLPLYLDYLKSPEMRDTEFISSAAIARALKLGEVQVRKDLNSVSGAGRPKVGYAINDLVLSLEHRLGYGKQSSAVIVGAGKLGTALLDYDGFSDYGLNIAAAFDSDPEKVGTSHCGRKIFSMDDFKNYCFTNQIRIGVISVPASAAQTVCDIMIQNGVTAIWNFAPRTLNVPDGVVVKQEDLALSLAHLNMLINNK